MSDFKLKQSWLDAEAGGGGRFTLAGGPDEMRAQFSSLIAAITPLLPPPSENVDVSEGKVGEVGYRVYKPQGVQGSLPTAVWYHGGGYVLGDLNTDDLLCRIVSEHAQVIVVGVDYRLAPEHKWPTQIEDAWSVYNWVAGNAPSFGGDPTRLMILGVSAGGGLGLGVAMRALSPGTNTASLKGVAAVIPVTAHPATVPRQYHDTYTSYKEFAKGTPVIDGESMYSFFAASGIDQHSTEAWPLLNVSKHVNFPATYLVSCEVDPLRDDALTLKKVLTSNKVNVKHDHFDGLPHLFWVNPAVPEGQEFVQKLIAGIMWLKSTM